MKDYEFLNAIRKDSEQYTMYESKFLFSKTILEALYFICRQLYFIRRNIGKTTKL
jgi:hypothetical protein